MFESITIPVKAEDLVFLKMLAEQKGVTIEAYVQQELAKQVDELKELVEVETSLKQIEMGQVATMNELFSQIKES